MVQIGSDWIFRFHIGISDFKLDSDWFQIRFRLFSEKNCKKFKCQIGSDWFRLAWEWIAVDIYRIISLVKIPRKCGPIFYFFYYNCLLVGREHTWPMGLGLSDFVLSREILLNGISELRPCNEIYQKVQYIAQTTFNFLWRRFFETQIFRRFPKISYIKAKDRDRITQYVVAPHTPRRSTFVYT